MTTTIRLATIATLLATTAGCGWLFGSDDAPLLDAEALGEAMPKCRPVVEEGEPPWTVGHETAGWKVTKLDDDHAEFVRVTFEKDDTATILEIAYSDGTVGDWSTEKHKLMPAPDETPPVPLLEAVMAELKAYDAKPESKPFARRTEGEIDAYADLPPCE